MPFELLDFEEPIAVVLKEIEALKQLPQTDARDGEVDALKQQLETVLADTET